jgi:hypothetical protein
MYERRTERPLSRQQFLWRLGRHVAAASLFAIVSLGGGMAGYAYFEDLGWRDSFLNAAMLLGGMGPVDDKLTPGGKIFAGLYALYAGLVFLVTPSIVLAPMLHRLLHLFHWDEEQGRQGNAAG